MGKQQSDGKTTVPSNEGSASGRLESPRQAAEDRKCDTPTDNCHNTATLHHPCRPDRTPCEHHPLPSPEDRSPPGNSCIINSATYTVSQKSIQTETEWSFDGEW